MPNYYNKIKHLYPTALDTDFELRDNSDGAGVFIKEWNTIKLGAKPPLASLDEAVDDATADATAEDKQRDRKFDTDTTKAMGLTMKDFMNEIIAGRVATITNAEMKTKFKSYL